MSSMCFRWCLLVWLFFSFSVSAQDTTLNDYIGNWSDNTTWISGISPGTNNLNDDVHIYGFVSRFGDLSFVNGDLFVHDTLVIYGDLTLGNNADLSVGPGAIFIVRGNYSSGNQAIVSNGGVMVVTGLWEMTGADNQGSFDNDGQLYIFDPDPDLKNGGGYDDLNCVDCVLGFDDLIASEFGDFFLTGSYEITLSGPAGFCPGDSVILSTTDTGTDYHWYVDDVEIPFETSDSLVVFASGDYHVTFKVDADSFALEKVTVTAFPLPVVTIEDLAAGYCIGYPQDTIRGLPAGGLFNASPDYSLLGGDSALFAPLAEGIVEFAYVYTDSNGCTDSASSLTTVHPLPVALIDGAAPSYCEGSLSDTLVGSPSGGVFAAGPGITVGGPDTVFFDPSMPGDYDIFYTYTDGNGCTDTALVSTIVHPLPDISTIGTDISYCIGEPADTIAGIPAGGTFVYTTGFLSITADSVMFDPSAEGNFDLRYIYSDVNSCTDSVEITIVVNPLPVLSVSGLLPDYCSNALVDTLEGNLTPEGLFFGDEINDLGNGTAEFTIGDPGIKNIYYTTADINGCTDTVFLQTEVYVTISVSFTGLDSLFDISDPAATLTGSPSGGVYSGNGITEDIFDPVVAGVGIHEIIYTFLDGNGCANRDTAYTEVRDYDFMAGAIILSDLDNWYSGNAVYTTIGATADGQVGSCWNYGNDHTRWFKFQATTDQVAATFLTGGSFGTVRRINAAIWEADGATQVNCNRYISNYDSVVVQSPDLVPGNWYYISVTSGTGGYRGTFSLRVNDQVDYDYYEGAIEITDITNWDSPDAIYTTLGATADKNPASCWNTGPNYNRWFKFQATNNTISVLVRRGGTYGTIRRINAAIWEEDGTTEVNCNRYISNDDEVYVEAVNLTPGNWYYLSVDNNYSLYRGTFSLSIDTRLTYDFKEGAYELQDINNWCSADAAFSTHGATPDLNAGSCWNTSPNYNRWFKFVATTHKINVEVKRGGTLGTIRRINVAIWESDGTKQISCNRYVGNDDNVSVGTDQLVPGNTYYISVDNNYSGYRGSFTLCIDSQMDYDYLEGAKDITTLINACSNNAEYTTVGATPDRTAPPCWNTSPNYNRWFKFMATTQSINVQLKRGGVFGTLRRAQIALFDKDSTTVLDCNRYVNNDDNVEVAYEGLIPGEWYFVSVDNNYSGYRGTFTLCLDDTPSYDFYEGAIELGILRDWTSSNAVYTTVGATPDKNAASCWNTSPNYNRWFKFTATTSQIHIEIRRGGSYGTIRRVNAAIWEADGETEVACKRYVNNNDIVEVEAINLIPGNTYYLSVDNNYSGYRGTFSLYVNDAVDYDFYEGAKDVTYLINSQSTEEEYTTVGATSDRNAGSCWNTSPNYNRWFKFQATTPGINIKVLRGGSYGTIRRVNTALFDADGATELSCNRYVNNDDIVELDYEGLTPGNWYYFSVDNNYSGYRGTFTLDLNDAVSYDYYEGAIELTDIHNWSSPDAAYSTLGATPDKNAASCWNTGPNYNRWFKFTATTPVINVEVRRGGSYGTIRRINAAIWEADGITEVACNRYVNNNDIVSLGANSLTPGNTYYISVDNNYSAYRGTFSLFVDDAMDYDFYEGAHEITDLNNWESQLAEFTTLGATADKNAASCWNASPNYNRWFKFRAIHTDVSIQVLRGGAYGSIRRINLALWESNGTTELACNRYASNNDNVSVTYSGLIPGNWYFISVDNNYSAYRGTFTLQVSNVSGNVYYAIADGNWSTASTWSLTEGGPPAVSSPANGDVVYIKGYDVTVSGTETCAELNIETENDQTSLTIDAGTITVNGKLSFVNNGHDVDGSLSILNSGNLSVIDDLVMDRSGGSNIFQLLVQDNSTLFVGNDMGIFSSAGSTINNVFTVSGTATVQIDQDLMLQNTGGIKSIITLNNSAELQVKRNIQFTSSAQDKLEIELNNDSRLYPGRTIQRDATPYGILNCNDNSTLVFNSSDYLQVIPENAGAGSDSFSYQNIEVNNTRVSVPQLSLEGHVSVPGTLTLTEGVIQTTAASLLTIENTGAISGGSANSYIQGPLEITGNNAVTFPVGRNGRYQPIAVSAPSSISDAFIAEYFDVNPDPLYDIDLREVSIDHIAECEYWTLQRSSGTSAVNITTSWDGNGCCISDMALLKLAVWDGTEWKDYGNGGTSGTLVSGEITTGNVVDINSFAITFADHLPVVDFTDPGGPYCESATPVNLTGSPEDANGIFTGNGITDNGNGTAQFESGTAGKGSHVITYSYTSVSGCNNSVSKNVTVNPAPTATIIGTDTVCIGTSNEFSIYLSGTAPWDITYSVGTNSYNVITSSNPYKFTTNVPAVYSVIALSDGNGCAGTDFGSSAELANWPDPAKPTTSIVSGSTTFCEGNSLVLTTPDALLYYWNNGVSPQHNTITNPGDYWVSIVDEYGCFSENSDTTSVIVHKTARKPTIISGSSTLCENSPNTTYSTSSLYADSYNWELLPAGSGSIIGTGQNISINWDDSFAGLAKLSVKGSNVNCGDGPVSDTLYIALDSLPDVDFDVIAPVCVNTPPFNLTQGSPGGGVYSGTGITTSPLFNPSNAGIGTHTLTYTFTSGNGCVNSATRNITVNALPTAVISGTAAICDGESRSISIDFTGTPPWSVTYSDGTTPVTVGGINSSPYTFNVSPSSTKVFTVIALSDSNCTSQPEDLTGSAIITVGDTENPTITPPSDVTVNVDAGVCEATGVALGSPITGDNCGVASLTNNAPAVFPVGATTVTWTVTDNAGNTATAEQTVTVEDNEDPEITGCPTDITVTADNEYCGNIVTWTAPTATDNCTVTFSGTHSTGDFFNIGTTTVTYIASDIYGNADTCEFTVTVLPLTPPVISGVTEVCTPVEVTYSVVPEAGMSYQWVVSEGSIIGSDTGAEVTVSWTGTVAGTVEVTATSGSGCSVSNSENITKYATPVVGSIVSGSQLTRR